MIGGGHTLLKSAMVALVLGPTLSVSTSTVAEPRGSLCLATEQTVFSCHVGRKIASLCTSRSITADTGYVYYAFGTPNAIELSTPGRSEFSRQSFAAGVIPYSGGGADYVRIDNARTSYIVYSGETPGWSQEGVAVEQDGKPVASLICSDSAMGPDGWQAIYAAKLPSDTTGFELPDPPKRPSRKPATSN